MRGPWCALRWGWLHKKDGKFCGDAPNHDLVESWPEVIDWDTLPQGAALEAADGGIVYFLCNDPSDGVFFVGASKGDGAVLLDAAFCTKHNTKRRPDLDLTFGKAGD